METSAKSQIQGKTLYLVKRLSNDTEKKRYRSNHLYSGHSLNGLRNLEGYDLKCVIPLGVEDKVPEETEPFKSIHELLDFLETIYQNELTREMINLYDDTRAIKWKKRDGREKSNSLLNVIKDSWFDYLYRYGSIEEDGVRYRINRGDTWTIINAIAKILESEKVKGRSLSDAFIKNYTEKWTNYGGTVIAKRGSTGFIRTDPEIRKKLVRLMNLGLVDYDPKRVNYEFGCIGFSPTVKFKSFDDFHTWLYGKVKEYNNKLLEKNEPSFILQEAENILEKFNSRDFD